MDMAEQHKDAFPCDYGTYGQWLACFPRFWKKVNTLIGLFYTTEGDWQEAPPAKTGPTQRRPWIGMLRPVDPHLNASNYSGALELLIWDGVARWPAKPQEKHLLPMQRKLVEAVRDELPRNPKYNGYHLQRVWVANFNMEVDADPSCPVDVACKMMEAIVDGKEGRAKYVPPWDELLLKAGWKLLNKAEVARPRFPHIPADDEEPERLIFHPPRGNVLTNSACTNDLYDAALEARRREPGCRLFPYHYKPTLQWFQNLKDEKRLYNHIDVDSWERIWTDLHVN